MQGRERGAAGVAEPGGTAEPLIARAQESWQPVQGHQPQVQATDSVPRGRGRAGTSALPAWLFTLSKFLVVGASGVLVNTIALFVLHQLMNLPLVVASALAVEIAIANNFFWNDRWTFGRKGHSFRRFFKFNLASLCGLAIATTTLWLLVTFAGIPYLLANLVGIVCSTGWNFIISLVWTWRKAC